MAITAEELIAKVAVVGTQKFQSDMGKIRSAGQKAAHGIGQAFSNLGKAILSPGSLLAGGGIVGTLFAFGSAALKASMDAEDFRTTLESLTGSLDAVKRKSEFIRLLDIPAKAGLSQLREAGLSVESFGLRIQKVLPYVAKLQAAFPQKDIQEAVRLFGRLAQGDFPDIENLSGFGLSKMQFMQRGIKFDANGSLLSSARETLDALANIVDTKYGNILDKIANNTSSKMASLQSAWTHVMEKLGDEVRELVLPVITELTGKLDDLAKNGGIHEWSKRFRANMYKTALTILEFFGSFGLLLTGIGALTKNAGMIATGIAMSVASVFGAYGIYEKLKAIKDEKLGYNPNIPIAPPLPGQVPQDQNPEKGWGQVSDPIKQIAASTRMTAEHTKPLADFAKQIFGGGPLGRLGITPVELAGFRRGGGGNQVTIQIYGGNVDQIQQQVLALKRRGLL